ncbi:MAG: hypothetical protein AAF184_14900 [Pseudomonadota bacterium]
MAERRARVDMLVATLAIAVSLAALFVSVLEVNVMRAEVRLMRAQERAAVWPYLDLGISYDSDGFSIEVANKGVGPALIKHVAVTDARGQGFTGWPSILDALLPANHGLTWSNYLTSGLAGTVLSPQEEVRAFRFPANGANNAGGWTDTAQTLASGMEGLTWQVCYCSVLDDCWIRRRAEEPQPTAAACAEVTQTAFEN